MSEMKEYMDDMKNQPQLSQEFVGVSEDKSIEIFQKDDFLKSECCSVNVVANARGLGKLASIMANKGKGLMSEESWNEVHANEVPEIENYYSK